MAGWIALEIWESSQRTGHICMVHGWEIETTELLKNDYWLLRLHHLSETFDQTEHNTIQSTPQAKCRVWVRHSLEFVVLPPILNLTCWCWRRPSAAVLLSATRRSKVETRILCKNWRMVMFVFALQVSCRRATTRSSGDIWSARRLSQQSRWF